MWRRLAAVSALFFLSPLVAEYLLGSLPMSMIAILPLMAMMYGSGALLIREVVRRTGRGWPSLVLLAVAYGFIEEGFVTQSLFNPNYLHLRLLDFGWAPALGTATPWVLFVVSIHTAWSISVPIALTESLFRADRDRKWLHPAGIAAFVLLFLAGAAAVAVFTYRQIPFMATPAQFGATAAIVLALIVAAFVMPRKAEGGTKTAPHPAILFVAALAAGSALMLVQHKGAADLHWSWQVCVALVVATEALFVAFMAIFTQGQTWSDLQRWALMAGGLGTYVWIGFPTDADLHGKADLPAHWGIAVAFVLLAAFAAWLSVRNPRSAT